MKKNKTTGNANPVPKRKGSINPFSLYKRMEFGKKRMVWGVIFLLPWLFGAVFFFLKPVVVTFIYAFSSLEQVGTSFTATISGLTNIKYVLTENAYYNRRLAEAFINMAQQVPFQIFLSLFIAIMLNGEYKGRGFYRAVFVIPIIIATGITTFSLSETSLTAATSDSVVNLDWLTKLVTNSGIPTSITSLLTTYVSNVFDVLTSCGVQVLLFLAGLQAISPSLYEVAKMEGCSSFETFCKITLPMVSPTILVCLVYSIAESFANATYTYGDKTYTFSSWIRSITFTGEAKYFGYGAAMSLIYMVAVLVTLGVVCGIVSRGVFYYD